MMVVATDITFETFGPEHLEGGHRLSSAAGWPHRVEDWGLTLSNSRGVVALEDGAVVGTAMCSGFGAVATLNMIIVDERMRGRGLGRRLMERVMAIAGSREMRLVATADGLPLYEKLGFVATGEILQFQGIASSGEPELKVERLDRPGIPMLAQMDLAASGMGRVALLSAIAAQGAVLRAEGGFAMLRAFGRGHVLGPVVARDPATARALMSAAASDLNGKFLRIDMPAARALSAHAESLGLRSVGGGIAMVRSPMSHPASEFQTFALVSQALG